MPVKKPAILLCSCNSLYSVSSAVSPISSITSSYARPTTLRYPTSPPVSSTSRDPKRRYATVNHNRSSNGSAGDQALEWPKAAHPTPYEIFGIRKDAPYTKARFYQLVKLYHPDKHSHSDTISDIPHATRTERYRLVVAANDLLSDPSKRNLYDTHGIGWTGGRPQTLNESMRERDRSWRYEPGNAAHNATWEDWERWYNARDGKTRDSMHMSNGLFAALVVMMCMVGALAQMSRASESGADFLEQKAQADLAIGRQMAKTSRAAAGLSKDERVDSFLRERENVAYQFVPGRFDELQSEQQKSQD